MLRREQHAATQPSFFERLQQKYGGRVGNLMSRRGALVGLYLAGCVLVIVVLVSTIGREIFPNVDVGQFQLRFHAPTGNRIEATEQVAAKIMDIIKGEVGANNVDISIGFVGVQPPNYPINTIYLWTSGSEEGVLQVELTRGTRVRVENLKERLRQKLASDLPDVRISFEPSDIVSRVMSLGSLTPVELAVSGPDINANRDYAEKLRNSLTNVAALRDLQFGQALDYPTVEVTMDRERAGLLGVRKTS